MSCMRYFFVRETVLTLQWCLALYIFPAIAASEENSCFLGEMTVVGDQSFSVEIVVSIGDTLAGFQIPFTFDYGDIQVECDSVSFAGGACDEFASQRVEINNESNTVYLSGIQNVHTTDYNEPLYPGTQIVCWRIPVI